MKKVLILAGLIFVLVCLVYAWDTHRGQFYDKNDNSITFSVKGSTERDTSEELTNLQSFKNLWINYRVRKGAVTRDSLDLYFTIDKWVYGRWTTLDSVMFSDSSAGWVDRTVASDSTNTKSLKAEKLRVRVGGVAGNDVDTSNTVTVSYFLRE